MFACSFPLDIQHSPRVELASKFVFSFRLFLLVEMDAQKNNEIVDQKLKKPYPVRMRGNTSMKANLRTEARSYELVDGNLKKAGLFVLHESDFVEEVQKIHGRFGDNHLYGLRNVETQLRKKWHCVGLRQKLHKLCKNRCKRCQLTNGGVIWFQRIIRQFEPPSEEVAISICHRLNLKYVGVPEVSYCLPFRQPMSVDAIAPNGNCVFLSILYSIGADTAQHAEFRRQVFAHLEREEIAKALREIYEDGFDLCLEHREEESKVHARVCGIVIHAAASLIGVDILVHWEGEDGVLEWMLGLASLKKRNWGSHQVALRWVNDHVDFVNKVK